MIESVFGGAEEDRTPDPLRARQVLSQLSYDPYFDIFVTLAAHLRMSVTLHMPRLKKKFSKNVMWSH